MSTFAHAKPPLQGLRAVITAGPTWEPLDEVRRLTNFSTGRLGTELGNHLASRGCEVCSLVGQAATYRGGNRAARIREFSTGEDLLRLLEEEAGGGADFVFHAAAVADYRAVAEPGRPRKRPTAEGRITLELEPTPKLIARLRGLFPGAGIAGWKYELDGGRASVLRKGEEQLAAHGTDLCILNGDAYGAGFGILDRESQLVHCVGAPALFAELERWMSGRKHAGA